MNFMLSPGQHNEALITAIKSAGKWKSFKHFAIANDILYSHLLNLLKVKGDVWKMRSTCEKICEVFSISPIELFPRDFYGSGGYEHPLNRLIRYIFGEEKIIFDIDFLESKIVFDKLNETITNLEKRYAECGYTYAEIVRLRYALDKWPYKLGLTCKEIAEKLQIGSTNTIRWKLFRGIQLLGEMYGGSTQKMLE